MQRIPEQMRAVAGFTLIETIVALVILSTVLVVFYNFLSTLLYGADRMNAAATAYDRRLNALELATTLNPMENPQGVFDLGTYRIRWSSRRLGAARRSSRYPAGRGLFTVALYRVTLDFPGDKTIAPISVTRLGYHRTNVPGLLGPAADAQP